MALVTGTPAGAGANSYDVDGTTSVGSRVVALPATTGPLTFRYYFAHSRNASSGAFFQVIIEDLDADTRTVVFLERASATDDDAVWTAKAVSLTPWAGKRIRIVFLARDAGRGSVVEAGVDDVRIQRPA
jgi:aminopeptidase S